MIIPSLFYLVSWMNQRKETSSKKKKTPKTLPPNIYPRTLANGQVRYFPRFEFNGQEYRFPSCPTIKEAVAVLERIVNTYPGTGPALLAAEKLREIR